MNVIVYLPSGEIVSSHSCLPQIAPWCAEEGELWIEGEGGDLTHYVDLAGPTITPKADYTLAALPLPCTLTIEGIDYPVTEQPTFAFNYPGTYTIEVDAGPAYLAKSFDYVAN
ncbi:MAG: hypothetical protein V7739_10995 [Motiliproteus sp.]